VAGAVRDAAQAVLVKIAVSVQRAAVERDEAQQARVVREGELLAVRGETRRLDEELSRLTDAVHRDEIARAEQRLRIEQLETRAVDEYGVEIEALIGEYGRTSPVRPAPWRWPSTNRPASAASRSSPAAGAVRPADPGEARRPG